jgi:hypothetical protein
MIVTKQYKLISYRDAGLPTFTYFWINDEERVVSPYFDSEQEAQTWMTTHGKLKYESFDEYFNEIENYGLRSERFFQEFNGMTPRRAVEWLRAVWNCARETK